MRPIRSLVLVLGLLFSAAVQAGEAPTPLTPAAKAFIADLERSSRWQLPAPIHSVEYTDEFLRPLPDIHFADSSLLARLSELRKVAFVTFVDRDDARLFLGVNDEGLVGIHFSAWRK